MNVGDELLRIEGVDAVYVTRPGDPPVRAVDNVSLVVHAGEVLGIAGESGCGKSTLAAVLALNARPPLVVKRGQLTFEGESVPLLDQAHIPADWRGKMM